MEELSAEPPTAASAPPAAAAAAATAAMQHATATIGQQLPGTGINHDHPAAQAWRNSQAEAARVEQEIADELERGKVVLAIQQTGLLANIQTEKNQAVRNVLGTALQGSGTTIPQGPAAVDTATTATPARARGSATSTATYGVAAPAMAIQAPFL